MQFSQKPPGVLAGLLAAISIVATSAPLRAELIGYNFGISEDLHVLEDPANMMVAKMAAWRPQHSLMMMRNRPFIELENLSTTAEIVQMSLTIGDLADNFDFASAIQVPAGVGFTVSLPQTVSDGIGSDLVTILFTGFVPQMSVRFQLDLDTDGDVENKLVDYRKVMFGSPSSPASQVSVKFNDGGESTLTNSIEDFRTEVPLITQLRRGYGTDHVRAYEMVETLPVPEPGGLTLLGLATVGLVLMGWRRRHHLSRALVKNA